VNQVDPVLFISLFLAKVLRGARGLSFEVTDEDTVAVVEGGLFSVFAYDCIRESLFFSFSMSTVT